MTPVFTSLAIGGTQQLQATVYDASDSVLAAAVTFHSNDTTVATVSASGLVTAVASGTTFIRVASGSASATVVVNVSGAATIVVQPDTVLLTGSQTLQLAAVARDLLGNVLPSAPVIFISRDVTIVTASATGVLTRTGVGTAYVVVASGTARDSALVTALIARVTTGGTPFGVGAISSSGAYVTLDAADSVQRLSLSTPAAAGRVGVGALPTSIAINHAGTIAYVGNQGSSSVSVISTSTNAVTGTIPITGTVLTVLVTPGDSLLLVASDAGRLYIVRLSTSAVVDSVPVPIANALVMRGDTTVFASEQFTGGVAEINLRTRTVVRTLNAGGVPQGVLVASNGTTLYLANEIGQLQIWNLTTGTMSGHVNLPGGGGFALAQDPTTGLLYVSTSYYGSRVHVIDPATQRIVRVIMTGGTPRRIAFAPDGSVGIVANEGGWIDYIK